MIEIHFYAAAVVVAAIWLLSRLFLAVRRRKIIWRQELKVALLFLCGILILRFTFFPLIAINGRAKIIVLDFNSNLPLKLNFRPFVHLLDYGNTGNMLVNIIGNAVMFLPLGILLPWTFPKLDRFFKVLVVGFLASLAIEIMQLPFHNRVSDVDDLVLNTLGCGVGYAIYCIVHKLRQKN